MFEEIVPRGTISSNLYQILPSKINKQNGNIRRRNTGNTRSLPYSGRFIPSKFLPTFNRKTFYGRKIIVFRDNQLVQSRDLVGNLFLAIKITGILNLNFRTIKQFI